MPKSEKFWGRCFNYITPISVFATDNIVNSVIEKAASDFAKQADEQIYQAVLNVGVNVSKKELEKALRYDREQYEKGYADGLKNADIVHGKWVQDGDYIICTQCHNEWNVLDNDTHTFDFCPKCGALMDGDVDEGKIET